MGDDVLHRADRSEQVALDRSMQCLSFYALLMGNHQRLSIELNLRSTQRPGYQPGWRDPVKWSNGCGHGRITCLVRLDTRLWQEQQIFWYWAPCFRDE